MDTISIHELEVPTHIGVTAEERASIQTLKVSIDMEKDLSVVGASDNVADTINYEAVADAIKRLGTVQRNTIERFAEDIAQMILADFKPNYVKVSVWKFILPDTDGVAVTITRP
ncbi:MAG: dihydroneopterin aldolase [Candidatus Peribacteraceae bacterium]|jgi:FolB domain-containing protein|nr:dihydroneopterin aldolase [Candidatus Peribacteraceae bacterium]|tara:strand:- start:35067 stop:35408 length:342 start_codon:yes stop_codon:yes gene_type:complete